VSSTSVGLSRIIPVHIFVLGLATVSIVTGAIEPPDKAAYEAAMNKYLAGDCGSAIPLLASVAASDGRANLPLGQCYFQTGSYQEAIKPLSAYLQQFPADDRGVILLARVYDRLSRAQAAIDVLTTYLNPNPMNLNARTQLGLEYLKGGDKVKSAAEFNAILQKAPAYPGALFGLGMIAVEEQHWPDAINYLSRVTQMAPDQVDAHRALGKVYEGQGQYDKAVGPYDQAFTLRPSDFATAKALAKCYAKLDKWNDVARVLRSDSPEEANDAEATELVQRALAATPQVLEEYCRRVIALNPKNTVALRVLAESAYSSKEMDRAKVEYLEILKLEPDDPDTNFKVGKIFEAEQKLADARRYYEQATKSAHATPQMYLALARLDLALNDAPGAKGALSKVTPPDSDSSDCKALIAQVDLYTNDFEGASGLLADLLGRDPNNQKLLNLAADTAARQERYADAVGFLERLLQADSGNKQVRYRLVKMYTDHTELKGDQRAMELLKDFVSKQDEDPDGYVLLANLYRRNKDIANAKLYFDIGFKKMPNPVPPRYAWAYSTYANFFFSQGQFEEALTEQLQATQLNPNDGEAQLRLGLIYLSLRKRDEAAEVLAKLEETDPKLASQLQEQARRSGLHLKTQISQ
jgi:tetratricopeptide (TPR) repeat protein